MAACREIFAKVPQNKVVLSQTARLISLIVTQRRQLSNLKIDYSDDGQVATFSLNRPPVNSFSMDFMTEITQGLQTVENKNCRGLIITSSLPNVFCGGLDLKEVLQSDKDRLITFRKTFQKMWSSLYGSKLVTMAAIRGHAIAGGCVLSLACDVSIMSTGYKIGLPELDLGLYLSPWMSGSLVNAVGLHAAEKIIYKAQVFPSEKAADIGMIHSIAPRDDVMQVVHEEMRKRLTSRDEPRQHTKTFFRQDLLDLLERTKEQDVEIFISTIMNEGTRKQIETRLQQLKTKTS